MTTGNNWGFEPQEVPSDKPFLLYNRNSEVLQIFCFYGLIALLVKMFKLPE